MTYWILPVFAGFAAPGNASRGNVAGKEHLSKKHLNRKCLNKQPFKKKVEFNMSDKSTHLVDRVTGDVSHGRFERSLSGLTALSAILVCGEVYYEHYKGSFGNKLMWSPIIVTPPLVAAGVAGVFSRRAAKTVLPLAAAAYVLTGLVGTGLHIRGVGRKPGGWSEKYAAYNVVMGPPVVAPGLFAMVGGMGLLAAILRREA